MLCLQVSECTCQNYHCHYRDSESYVMSANCGDDAHDGPDERVAPMMTMERA